MLPSLAGGGAERVTVTLLRHLDRDRFHLSLAVVNLRDAVYLPDVPADVEIIDLDCRRARYAIWKVVSLLRKRRPDVVFSTLGHLNLLVALLMPLLPKGIRYVAREASIASKIMYMHAWPRLMSWLYRRLYKRFDCIVCQSEAMRHDLIETYGLSFAKAVIVANPVDIEKVRGLSQGGGFPAELRPNYFNIVTAGRLSYEKGMDLLLHAISLCADIPLNVVILGDGPLRHVLEQQIVDSGIGDRVILAGFQINPYIYFAHADLFVLSSRIEGFPNVVLEALACGTPVVATPCADVLNAILNGSGNGWLAEDISAKALAASLHMAYGAPQLIPDIKQLESRFGVREIVGRYEELLLGVEDGREARTG